MQVLAVLFGSLVFVPGGWCSRCVAVQQLGCQRALRSGHHVSLHGRFTFWPDEKRPDCDETNSLRYHENETGVTAPARVVR
jgi:hypothetical protein